MTQEKTKSGGLDRAEAVSALVGNPDDFLIIAGLAGPAKDILSKLFGAQNSPPAPPVNIPSRLTENA